MAKQAKHDEDADPVTDRGRTMVARAAAATRWAKTVDRTEATEPMRRGLREKWAREVDPDGVLSESERERRIAQLEWAHMVLMSRLAAKARKARAKAA